MRDRYPPSLLLALFLLACVLPWCCVAKAGAVIRFNGGDPITANGSYTTTPASKISPGGGVILHFVGTFDTATFALEVDAGAGWIPAKTCNAVTAQEVCDAGIGPVNMRITVTGAGASTSVTVIGHECQAVAMLQTGGGAVTTVFARAGDVVAVAGDYECSEVTGCVTSAAAGTHAAQHQHGGADEIATATAGANAIPKAGAGGTLAASWIPPTGFDTVGTGTNSTATMTVGTGSSITTTGTGRVLGMSLSSPDLVAEPPAAGGFLNVRAPGGVHDLEIAHDGSNGYIRSTAGTIMLRSHGGAGQTRVRLESSNPIFEDTGTFGFQIMSSTGVFGRFVNGWGADYTDTDTLLFDCGDNCVGLKAGGTETLRAYSDRTEIRDCKVYGKLSTAPSGAACDRYYDTDVNRWCFHSGSGWLQVDDSTTSCS